MNLSSARGVANLKIAYSLTPFNQQVPEFAHPGPSLPIQALPSGLFSQYMGSVLLVVAKEV